MNKYLLTPILAMLLATSCRKECADIVPPQPTNDTFVYIKPAYRMEGRHIFEGWKIRFYRIPNYVLLDSTWYDSIAVDITTISDSNIVATATVGDTTVRDTLHWATYVMPDEPTIAWFKIPDNPKRYGCGIDFDTLANKVTYYGFGATIDYKRDEQFVTHFEPKQP